MTEPPTSPATPNEPTGTPPPPGAPGTSPYAEGAPGTSPSAEGAPGTSPYAEGGPGSSPYGTPRPYGAPPGQPAPYASGPYGRPAGPPRNGMGTAALILGIVAIPGILTVVLGILLGLLALIFGIIGRKRYSRREATNGGAAMAGAILGGIALAVSIILVAVGATFFAKHKSDIEKLRDCINNAQTQQQRQACQDQFQRDVTG
jgi:hypothetical protein